MLNHAETSWPGADWESAEPEELGLNRARLLDAGRWQAEESANRPYRVLIVRHGKIAAEWNFRVDPLLQAQQGAASEATFSCVLGVAIAEGVIKSADDRVADYYPEMMDVPPGAGTEAGRHAFPENEGITFRHLLSHTSGYMMPGELPGKAFNRQAAGMNVLTHAIAAAYSLYKTKYPERGAGFGTLTEWKLRNPLGGTWSWEYRDEELPPAARSGVFGYFTDYKMTAPDMARCGLLWMRRGEWDGRQVVPAEWMERATQVNGDVLANSPEQDHRYGLGFWCNDRGKMWPDLPSDSFAASGEAQQHVWVCPSLELIVARSPGTYRADDPSQGGEMLELIAAAVE